MARDMETVIRISGNLDASLRRVIEQAAERIEQLNDVARQSADAVDAMSDKIRDQSNDLKKAQRQYANYVLAGERSSEQAKELAKKIQRLSRDLRENRSAMNNAERAAQQLAEGFDDAEREADDLDDASRNSGDGFSVMKGAMAGLVSSGIQSLIEGCANAISSLYGLSDSTREFRQDMSTLETAYDRAGFTVEQATDTWTDLYAIFGEDDRAVEAANNIARIADSQAELDQWTRITTGIWGIYQDALPVESLAEAAGETITTGTVTGALADALNWSSEAASEFSKYMSEDVVTAEDAFNVALSKCTTEAERNALVTDTLTALYGDAADKYNETAGSIIDANKANADYTLTLAEMGEKIEPVSTAVKSGLTDMLAVALDLMDKVDMAEFSENIEQGFGKAANIIGPIAEDILPSLGDTLGIVLTAVEPLVPVILSLATDVFPVWIGAAQEIISAIAPAIPIIANLVTDLLPIVTTLIAGLSPIISTLISALMPVLSAIGELVSGLMPPLISVINVLMPIIGFLAQMISGTLASALQAIQPIIDGVTGYFQSLISFIQNIFLGNWSEAWESAKSIFSNAFQALAGILKAPINAVISIINGVISAINSVGFDIPDWVPIIGGSRFSVNIPQIPMFAKGGFTEGASIAGEAGMEAVISFDRSVREANIGYWAKAGRMLGATAEDAGFELSGESGGDTIIDMGGITFAPNITFSGKADKESVIKAIEEEYPEFLDMLERWLIERGATVYA